ncbi:Tol-Pal system beta propeller repeat protein TolB [Jannaschia aquimarina]|uniref:Tol-Pal system protein TolB n=1 Tax=Jannaschia aquimarina TaxID=935700 RepID=A0A0D1EF81_9RHOB|nr:Tol-Pal system beta propeller repeat protein TolB [Jannaschia aquimarina]KIT15546.1 Protein TolB [Jannaschia aquimarina]SNT34849.1 TolB protein [Jannaschia aquimarina]
MKRLLFAALTALAALAAPQVQAQDQPGPLRITITDGVIEPIRFAVPNFVARNAAAGDIAQDITRVISADLANTGLFEEIPQDAHIARVSSFDSSVQWSDWKAINAQALITGSVLVEGDGRLIVQFRLFDVFSEQPLGEGLQFVGTADGWRRMAHKVADAAYSRITGEDPYFDSRVVFVSETGPKDARLKRLAIMDYDGANVQYLTSSDSIVLAPRFSPDGAQIIYTSYESGFPRVTLMDVASLQRRTVGGETQNMSFAPRFSPSGDRVVYSAEASGNTDLYALDIATGATTRLTSAPSIETAPSFSPDGSQIVFESDRSGQPQLYVMPASGGEAQRISFGDGRYGTPVWSPRGDYIAFTKQTPGRFHIGVMRTDGSQERLLTGAFIDEGPTWSPNGRVIMFTRETPGAAGAPALYSVDITGRNLQRAATPAAASDPNWGPLLN